MFIADRKEVLGVIKKMQMNNCAYASPNFCDCKYGFDNKPYGEQTGCPELRCVIELLSNVTDKEYNTIICRNEGNCIS